jgi:hypothetical protein
MCYSLSQWMDTLSSNLFLHTLQNFRLWWNGSDQQWATGFWKKYFTIWFASVWWVYTLIRLAAMLEHGDTTVFRQRSCTTKLHTGKNEDNFSNKKHTIYDKSWSMQPRLLKNRSAEGTDVIKGVSRSFGRGVGFLE